MSLKPSWWALLAAVVSFPMHEAAAACHEGASFVRVDAQSAVAPSDDDETRALVEALIPHLRAELRARDIGVCGEGESASGEPIATIVLQEEASKLRITIVDRVTDKSVLRTLDLSTLPRDTRLLAVAASVDELLRASWLETLFAPSAAAPAPVRRAVVASLPAPEPPPMPPPPAPPRVRGELGVDALATATPGLRAAFGADLQGSYWPHPRWGLLARLGGSAGIAEDSVNGTIASDWMRAGLGAAFAVLPVHERFGVRVEGRVDAGRLTFRGTPDERGARAESAALVAATGSLGVRSWLDLARGQSGALRGFVGVAASWALAPAIGTDRTFAGEEIEVTGISGLGIDAALGAAWVF